MAALDFPASPTVGQVATLTNGFSYTWDGSVWALTASTGQTAGGDLTGTYPNPTIGAGAVTRPKLAAGAPVGNTQFASVSFSTSVQGGWLTVATLPSLTVRGGLVFLLGPHGLSYVNAAATAGDVWLKWIRDGTDLAPVTLHLAHAGTLPLPPHITVDTPTAGAHVYALAILPNVTGSSITSSNGFIVAYEVS